MTSYCVGCGEDFVDGDVTVERGWETLHKQCEATEQAIDATWQDAMEVE